MKAKICVPIMGKNRAELFLQAKEAAGCAAEMVEWRADFFDGLCAQTVCELLPELKAILAKKELLFTVRTKEQGGELACTGEQYESVLCAAIQSGQLSYVDLEDSTEEAALVRLVALARRAGVRSIASYHNFLETPPLAALMEKFWRLSETGADILKTAYMPRCAEDVAQLLLATAQFRAQDAGRHELITMSMGALGKISRVGGGVFGSSVSFASVCGASAPGQIDIAELKKCMEVLA